MTLRSSFFKLLKEDMKRRVWCITLFSVILFLLMPVLTALRIQNTYLYDVNKDKLLIYSLGTQNTYLVIVVVIFAVVCGLSSFFYLHSRKKVDLYHSLPIKREMIFGVNYINGLLIFFIPYFINVVLCILVGVMNDALSQDVLISAGWGLIVHMLYYCMLYTVTIIAVMLTGNIITSFLGTIVFFVYGYVLLGIKESYFMEFFKTYYTTADEGSHLSPIGCYNRLITLYRNGESFVITLLIHFIIVILLIGIALLLFKKRTSEVAGKPMSFEVSKPIIKFFLVIPLSLGGGIVLKNAVNNNSGVWFLFGIMLSLIIINTIIQVIFNFDIRAALHNKIQFVICAVVIMVIVGVFKYDILGYDSYIPKQSQIKSMGVYLYVDSVDYQSIRYMDQKGRYIDATQYHLDRPLYKNISSAYSLAKYALEKMNQYQPGGGKTYYVKYNLKDGRSVCRRYTFSSEDTQFEKDLFNSHEYKVANYPIFDYKLSEVDVVVVNYNDTTISESGNGRYLELKGDKSQKLLSIYKEELSNLSYEEMNAGNYLARLNVKIYNIEENIYHIYPSFTKTIAYIKECGLEIR